MRERARSCGGDLAIGASPRGGWRVEAVLPLPVAVPVQVQVPVHGPVT